MKYKLLVLIFSGLIIFGCTEESPDFQLLDEINVDFEISTDEPEIGSEIQFLASDQKEYAVNIWEFGDGVTSYLQSPYHTYHRPGEYRILYQVADGEGGFGKKSKLITVADTASIITYDFPAEIAWMYTLNNPGVGPNDATAPSIGLDGTVYYIEGEGTSSHLVALNDNINSASLKWKYNIGVNIRQAATIGFDGFVYIGAWSTDGIFSFDNETGTLRWNKPTVRGLSNCTCALDEENNIYFSTRGSAGSGLFSFASDGTERWSVLDLGSAYSSPALSRDQSTCYFLETATGSLYAINTLNGNLKWSEALDVSDGLGTSVSIDEDGTIYITTNTEIIAVADQGSNASIKWVTGANQPNSSGIVIGSDGTLYTGSTDGLLSVNPEDGNINWTFSIVAEESVPAIDINGNIYIGSVDGKLHIINTSGEKVMEFVLGNDRVLSPIIADDGSVFVEATMDTKIILYKIYVENSGPADSPWPMKGRNVQHTSIAK